MVDDLARGVGSCERCALRALSATVAMRALTMHTAQLTDGATGLFRAFSDVALALALAVAAATPVDAAAPRPPVP